MTLKKLTEEEEVQHAAAEIEARLVKQEAVVTLAEYCVVVELSK